MDINWDEFKIYKKEMPHLGGDNFTKLVSFVRSFYNISSTTVLFEMLSKDEIATLMLKKRDLKTPSELERYLQSI